MRATEHIAGTPIATTGFFATLRGLLRVKGSAAPLAPRLLLSLLSLAAAFLATTAPASAQFKTTFVRELTGFGGLSPDSVTVDDFSGDVLVADSGSGLIQVFNRSGVHLETWNGANTPAKSFGGAGVAVAANNATGVVYVVDHTNGVLDVFESTGKYVATWNGSNTPAGSFTSPAAVAVNQANGEVYVAPGGFGSGETQPRLSSGLVIDVFDSSGKYLSQISGADTPLGTFGELINQSVTGFSLAVDGVTGHVFVTKRTFAHTPHELLVFEFDGAGKYVASWNGVNTPNENFGFQNMDVAVSEATGDVLVENTRDGVVDVFDSAGDYTTPQITGEGTPAGVFGNEKNGLPEPAGVAVDQATGDIYISTEGGVVDVFAAAVVPDVVAAAPSSFTTGGVTLNGTVNPGGVAVTSCGFEYVSDAAFKATGYTDLSSGGSAPCVPASIEVDRNMHGVHADVSGLQPRTLYHFRLDAANKNGSSTGQDMPFFESTAPLIEGEPLSQNVGSVEAGVGAQIDAAGLSTSYHVEYATGEEEACFTTETCRKTADVSLGNARSASAALAQLSGLLPATKYRFRFVANNTLGTTLGSEGTFATFLAAGASGSALPDGRVYELVSPLSGEDREVYVPLSEAEGEQERGEYWSGRPTQASSDGNAIAYVGEPSPGGDGDTGRNTGNEYLAVRSAGGGWSASNITPRAAGLGAGVYTSFSSDLSTATLYDFSEHTLAPGLSVPPECIVLYSRQLNGGVYGGFQPLFTKGPVNSGEKCDIEHLRFAGASADGSHIFFATQAALTAGAPGHEESDLYESVAGQLRLVNVLPGGKPEANATFGSGGLFVRQVVSTDGSRVFWTDLNNGDLYVRENNFQPEEECTAPPQSPAKACTVQVSQGAAQYQTASTDGRYVFYIEAGVLWRFDTTAGARVALASLGLKGENAEVQGVVGSSVDGSYVYFVANGALAGNENTNKETAAKGHEQGLSNLYLAHGGETTFVATLSTEDYRDWYSGGAWLPGRATALEAPDLDYTAQVTPDGHSLVFSSSQRLTGYDNFGSRCVVQIIEERATILPGNCGEVFVYDAGSARVFCASCAPNGSPPAAGGGGALAGGGFLSHPTDNTRLPRWISADGSKVFFDTAEQLVAQDTNGKVDVYEWERQGSGGCTQSQGCVYLLSGGSSASSSWFLDASATGGDVFFATREQLVPADQNDNVDVYDARVGAHPLSPPACSGAGCQGVPPAPPIFATPSSLTFSGVGNFPPPGGREPIKKTAAQIRAEKLAKALRTCRKKRNKHGRTSCEKQARKRYAPAKKASRAKRPGNNRRTGR